jgi:hypothetical protein
MAELADALDLGSSAVKGVQVQVLFPAPKFFKLWSNTLICCKSEVSTGFRTARPLDSRSRKIWGIR